MMRASAPLLAVAALAGVGTSTAGAAPATTSSVAHSAASATPVCGPAGDRTLAASPSARVYASGPTVYGCVAGRSGRLRLGSTRVCIGTPRVSEVAVAGDVAALATTSCGVDTGSTVITVRRLRDGVTLSDHPAIAVNAPESFTSVTGLVLTPGGHVAWIGHASSIARHTQDSAVFAAVGAHVRTLDRGEAIVAGSLRLRGTTLSWRHGGARRMARL